MKKAAASKNTPMYRVAKSRIHGLGVFAVRRIRKGQIIDAFEGRLVKRNGPHVLWVEDAREPGSTIGLKISNDLRYLNHQRRKANAVAYGEVTKTGKCVAHVEALCTILPGTEITFDYGW